MRCAFCRRAKRDYHSDNETFISYLAYIVWSWMDMFIDTSVDFIDNQAKKKSSNSLFYKFFKNALEIIDKGYKM